MANSKKITDLASSEGPQMRGRSTTAPAEGGGEVVVGQLVLTSLATGCRGRIACSLGATVGRPSEKTTR